MQTVLNVVLVGFGDSRVQKHNGWDVLGDKCGKFSDKFIIPFVI